MNGMSPTATISTQPMSRDLLLTLIEAALRTGELRYARRLCTSWLALFPGDLQVSLLFAHAYHQEKSRELQLHALPILEELCKLDPEFLEAQELLSVARQLSGSDDYLVAKACAHALTPGKEINTENIGHVSGWAKYLHEASEALHNVRSGDYQQIEKAEYYIHKALVENPDTPLAAVVHLKLLGSQGSMPKVAVRSLAQIYHERWPDCLQFLLTLSNELIEAGESDQAVSLLHQAVTKDITGQVPSRMWGSHHQYTSLWPSKLVAGSTGPNSPQSIPVPAAVSSHMGWNQLPAVLSSVDDDQKSDAINYSGTPVVPNFSQVTSNHTYIPHNFSAGTNSSELSEQARSVQAELERLADELKRPHLVHEDGRFPVYVIFTTRGGIESQYGLPAFQQIDVELKRLAKVVRGYKINQEYWGSLLFYADDISCTSQYELQPAAHNDPRQLKLILTDLNGVLEKRGERVGALLIVGGPEIVPFHNLPNPVEDADTDVPSDNPYAAKDGNYFICDWPVGRLSGGADKDPHHLSRIIKEIANRYDPKTRKFAWYRRIMSYLQELFRRGISKKQSSFGYTAAVWRRASLSVFRSIGEADDLLVSPPTHTCAIPGPLGVAETPRKESSVSCLLLPTSHLGYFNLHGVPDGSEWYGQSDPTQPEVGPDFPIAMRPEDIHNSGSAPRLVFTEACYGANISGKTVDEAISLKFLASGTHALIGSTCISYGSLTTPLSSADLLGRVFWSLLQEGFTAGESLRRAKIHLTREMHRRQGFLDAEDQKTLISFVLFGDPLAQPFLTKVSPKITPHLSDSAVPVPTVCEHSSENGSESPIPLETLSHLKIVVEQYLPGMSDAKVSLTQERPTCSNSCGRCSSRRLYAQSKSDYIDNPPGKYHRRIVTLSKSYERANYVHRQYARLTLDESGKIIKMVVSH